MFLPCRKIHAENPKIYALIKTFSSFVLYFSLRWKKIFYRGETISYAILFFRGQKEWSGKKKNDSISLESVWHSREIEAFFLLDMTTVHAMRACS